MATWLIIAILATIGVTALLMGALYRINAPRKGSDDGGGVHLSGGGGAGSGRQTMDKDGPDSGSDGGGGDGGGGGD